MSCGIKLIILAEMCIKMRYFYPRMAKIAPPPPDPLVSGGWRLHPQTPSLRRLGASDPPIGSTPALDLPPTLPPY